MNVEIPKLKFDGWEKFQKKLNEYSGITVIQIWIRTDDKEHIRADIKWCNGSDRYSSAFPYTSEGYIQACEFIQKYYEEMIKELVEVN